MKLRIFLLQKILVCMVSAFHLPSPYGIRTSLIVRSDRGSPSRLRSQSSSSSSLQTNATSGAEQQRHSTLRVIGKGYSLDEFQLDTRIVRGGYAGDEWTTDPLGRSLMSPPVWHASTITFPNVAALKQAPATGGLLYGRLGTPTTWALEEAFAVLEGADNACVACSGVAATIAVLTAFVKSGDHILISDGVYEQTRRYCDYVRCTLHSAPSPHAVPPAPFRRSHPPCKTLRSKTWRIRSVSPRSLGAARIAGAAALRGRDHLHRPVHLRRGPRAPVPAHDPGGAARARSELGRGNG